MSDKLRLSPNLQESRVELLTSRPMMRSPWLKVFRSLGLEFWLLLPVLGVAFWLGSVFFNGSNVESGL
ncbi:hypothetical protein [Leptothermofonsia sp. ETS-13]|uniref:hypothetical protein n=1 Tax=Leptothermofonsia sp. ETS-13 TaxID=3035696 RepID=UPI003BA1B71E